MRAINPIYIGFLLLSILAISIYSLNSAKSDLKEAKEIFLKTSKVAIELNGLKKAYSKNSSLQNTLKRLLSQKILREANINAKFKKNSLLLESKEMNIQSLNYLMEKILNATYNVTSMKIKKINESKASFEMEIKW